jgi:hypothetical protein
MNKEGVPMGKGKLIAKGLGIALAFVLIGAMLGGLSVTPSPFAEFVNQNRALAQGPPELKWSKTFGGPADDFGWSVQQTSDGGYVIAGYTSSYGAGAGDVWLIKTDSNDNEVWDKTFGGTSDDGGMSVQQTSDGGYVIAGSTSSYGAGGDDVWLIKTDSNGNEVWDKTFGGTSDDGGMSVQQISDGGYVIAGYTSSYGAGGDDVWLITTDSNGNEVWDKTFGGTSDDIGVSIRQISDDGYIVVGYTSSYGAGVGDVWLIKTDSNGNEAWDKTFGGTSSDGGLSVQQTSDSGYVIAGSTSSYGAGGNDVWLIKTDSNGNRVWDKTFGGTSEDAAWSVQQTSDGGYVIAGYTSSYGAGGEDVWLIKTNSNGNEVWDKTFGGASFDNGMLVQQTSDSGYVIAGSTTSYGAGAADVWLIRRGPEGEPSMTPGGTPIWLWIIVATGAVSLVAIIVHVVRRKVKTQRSE